MLTATAYPQNAAEAHDAELGRLGCGIAMGAFKGGVMKLSVPVVILVGLVVAGCVTTSPIPEGYTGPTATIHDSVRSESGTRAVLFFVSEIDGKQIETSLGERVVRTTAEGSRSPQWPSSERFQPNTLS